MSSGHIVAPYAQVSELYWRRAKINSLIEELCAFDKLHLCNGATDCYSFLETRREYYSEHRSAYGMYFGKKQPRLQFRPSPSLHTTKFIKSTLLAAVSPSSQSPNIFSHAEIDRLRKNTAFIRNEFQDSPFAATFTVYGGTSIAPKPFETRFFGDISSRLFINHYAGELDLISPTGFFCDAAIEHYDYFPVFDVDLNVKLAEKLGIIDLLRDTEFHRPYLNLISDKDFPEFAKTRALFLYALLRSTGADIGDGTKHNYTVMAQLEQLDFGSWSSGAPQTALLLTERLLSTMTRASHTHQGFAEAMEVVTKRSSSKKPLLLFTATDTEDAALRAMLAVRGYIRLELRPMSGFTGALFRNDSGTSIWHVRTSAGSSGTHGSARVSELAIRQISPAVVFSVGICFGVDEKKQKLGDVVVSEYVCAYERGKYNEGTYEWRGDKVPSWPDAVSYARQYSFTEIDARMIVGSVLSGDKLVNDAEFRSVLKEVDSQAVAGEMEAAGLAQSCGVLKVPFSMIKGICDFAVGKDDTAQELAARNAFRFAFDTIDAFASADVFDR
ncbi:phosphorylase family protein [Methylorubrum populi]|uniref:5'-methylthioadenosine/S-adenosylhomocysteine nucleosidase family protein n=1 Tax=Methylorubrum populi TaxID=223967 RepID=UPI003F658F73